MMHGQPHIRFTSKAIWFCFPYFILAHLYITVVRTNFITTASRQSSLLCCSYQKDERAQRSKLIVQGCVSPHSQSSKCLFRLPWFSLHLILPLSFYLFQAANMSCMLQCVEGSAACRAQLKCDDTRWRTWGEVKGKLVNGVGSQYLSHYLGTWCIQHYYQQ